MPATTAKRARFAASDAADSLAKVSVSREVFKAVLAASAEVKEKDQTAANMLADMQNEVTKRVPAESSASSGGPPMSAVASAQDQVCHLSASDAALRVEVLRLVAATEREQGGRQQADPGVSTSSSSQAAPVMRPPPKVLQPRGHSPPPSN